MSLVLVTSLGRLQPSNHYSPGPMIQPVFCPSACPAIQTLMYQFGYKNIEEDSIKRLKKAKVTESLKAVRWIRHDFLLVKLC